MMMVIAMVAEEDWMITVSRVPMNMNRIIDR
jgi:hypothetical protein